MLYLSGIRYSKFNALGRRVAGSRKGFSQSITFPHSQLFDIMRLLSGHPFIDHVSILIRHLKVCSGKLLSCRDICLGNLKPGDIILHHYMLYLPGIRYSKLNALGCSVTGSRKDLSQDVGFSHGQFFNVVRFLSGHPLIDHVSIPIRHLKMYPRKLFPCRDVCLGDLKPGNIILHHNGSRILLSCKGDTLSRSITGSRYSFR